MTGGLARKENGMVVESWETMRDQAEVVQKSGLAPKSLNTPEKVLTVALKGRELSMPMMQSLSHIHIIEGRPTLSAEAMLALVQRSGHLVRVIETTSEKCVVEGVRRNDPGHKTRIEWTMDNAKAAGIAEKNTWKNYPRAMLRSRAVSELCRAMFADTLSGASYTPEELGAAVNGEGEIVDTEFEPHRESYGEIEGEATDEAPASRKQLNYLESLITDVVDGGMPAFQDSGNGKRIAELTREEASDWIAGLTGGRTDQSRIREGQANRLRRAIADAGRDERRFEESIGPIGELSEAEFSKWTGRLEREIAEKESEDGEDAYELSDEDAREVEEIPS